MIRSDQGMYIQIDGIDGSGKSTLFQAARDWFGDRVLSIFDVTDFCKREHRFPSLEEVGDADVLFTSEPSHAWVGRAIRDEVIRTGTPYDARFAAESYALDRAIQINRLVKPFLEARPGRWILQDRGLISSLAYQVLQSRMDHDTDPITEDWLLAIHGNRIAYDFSPDHFILVDLDAEIARSRLDARDDKQDDARFEQIDFQRALSERYRQQEVTKPFEKKGTLVHRIDGWLPKEHVAEQMIQALERIAHPSPTLPLRSQTR
jgi:thymidylate kinase